jgi:predicted Fe-S protein YdhL (DUF1289 family)
MVWTGLPRCARNDRERETGKWTRLSPAERRVVLRPAVTEGRNCNSMDWIATLRSQ